MDKKQVLDDLVAVCAPLGALTGKSMSGGIGAFCDGSMFAPITRQGEPYLKADDENREAFEKPGLKKFGRMPYYQAPDDARGNWQTFAPWAEGAFAENNITRGLGIILDVVGYARKQPLGVAGGAAVLGGGVIAFQFAEIAALGMIVIAILVAAVIGQLGISF